MVSTRLAWTLLNDAFRSTSSSLEVVTVSGEAIPAFMMWGLVCWFLLVLSA